METFDWQALWKRWHPYRIPLAAAASLLLFSVACLCAWFSSGEVRTKAAGAYHGLARYVGLEEEAVAVAIPSESPTGVTSSMEQVVERISELEAAMQAQKIAFDERGAHVDAMREQLKAAVAEVAATNDLLESQQREWLATLKRVGAVSAAAALATPTPSASSEPSSERFPSTPTPVPNDGKVNINTASASELDALPAIGATYAQRIVDYRNQKGPFTKPEDIMEVSGIGASTYEKIKDLIKV